MTASFEEADAAHPGHYPSPVEPYGFLDARPDDKVLLIGRASKIGDLRYNRRLSGQRALAVRDVLLAKGVAANRIETLWLG